MCGTDTTPVTTGPEETPSYLHHTRGLTPTYGSVSVSKAALLKYGSAQLEQIGVRDTSAAMRLRYPEMPTADKGWGAHNALFKIEKGNANIGLGHGDALDVFNDNLVHSGKVS